MNVTCYFDGACEPVNPLGHTSWGLVVKIDSRIVHEDSGYVGVGEGMSNNVAEYAGCIAALEYLIKNKITHAIVRGDSMMVVRQMNKYGGAKKGLYIPYFKIALNLRKQLPNVRFEHVPREKNTHADYLSKVPLKGIPRSTQRTEELRQLIREQKEDQRKDRLFSFGPVGASKETKGTPF